jgi:hypothetical protein
MLVMLSLDDPIWRELRGGYGIPYDASQTLVRMEHGESVWEELWEELHHGECRSTNGPARRRA